MLLMKLLSHSLMHRIGKHNEQNSLNLMGAVSSEMSNFELRNCHSHIFGVKS
jgi:hypothetical protein